MKFSYTISTKTGEVKRGTVDAALREEAERLLERSGWHVILLEEKRRWHVTITFPFTGRLSVVDKIFLTRHLALLIKSGFPLKEGLLTIKDQAGSSLMRRITADLIRSINNGESLSRAFSHHHLSFDQLFINVVGVGEKSGRLEENLEYLSGQLEKEYGLRKRVVAAMIYPLIVLALAMAVTLWMFFFILPKLLPLFQSLEIDLPLTTRILVAIAEFSQANGSLLLFVSFYLVFFWWKLKGAILVGISVFFWVLPYALAKILPAILAVSGGAIPGISWIMKEASRFTKAHDIITFGAVLLVLALIKLVFRFGVLRSVMPRIIMVTPIFGKIYKSYVLAFLTRNLGTLLKSGVPVIEAFHITVAITTSPAYHARLEGVSRKITEGQSLGASLGRSPSLFPVTLSRMIAAGEKSGNLDETLEYLAEFYEREVDSLVDDLSNVLQPALLIFVGLVVLFIALSIISPIYKFTESIR